MPFLSSLLSPIGSIFISQNSRDFHRHSIPYSIFIFSITLNICLNGEIIKTSQKKIMFSFEGFFGKEKRTPCARQTKQQQERRKNKTKQIKIWIKMICKSIQKWEKRVNLHTKKWTNAAEWKEKKCLESFLLNEHIFDESFAVVNKNQISQLRPLFLWCFSSWSREWFDHFNSLTSCILWKESH